MLLLLYVCHCNSELVLLSEHQCESCGKLYRSRQGLAGHLVHLHGKEAPYKCGTCEKAFLSKTLFRSHVLGHSEVSHSLDILNTILLM